MIRAVDTSAWIEGFILGKPGSRILQEMPERDRCVVPTIVQLELAKWLARNATEQQAAEIIAYTTYCLIVDLDTQIALRAADFSQRYKLPTADAIIYATAVESQADLLTCDAHFEGLPGVVYLKKSG